MNEDAFSLQERKLYLCVEHSYFIANVTVNPTRKKHSSHIDSGYFQWDYLEPIGNPDYPRLLRVTAAVV